jgi:hypothetical protein
LAEVVLDPVSFIDDPYPLASTSSFGINIILRHQHRWHRGGLALVILGHRQKPGAMLEFAWASSRRPMQFLDACRPIYP